MLYVQINVSEIILNYLYPTLSTEHTTTGVVANL